MALRCLSTRECKSGGVHLGSLLPFCAASGANLMWNMGVVDPGPKQFRYVQWNFPKNSIFTGKFPKKLDFSGKFPKNFDLFTQISKICRFFRQKFPNDPLFSHFLKNFYLSRQICHLQQNSWQIILFRLKCHHFRTYFLYAIRYNFVSRPFHDPPRPPWDPHDPPSPKSGGCDTSNPKDWRLCVL